MLLEIDELKVSLRHQLNEPRRWSGALRRMSFARIIQGSNSIEGYEARLDYLGHNTLAYYDVLAQVGGGSWQPTRDTRPWIRFILTAHLRQAQTLQRRVRASERLWVQLETLVQQHGLPERSIPALFDATNGYRLRRSTYAAALADNGDDVSDQTATRDLKAHVDAGVLDAQGDKRGRAYTAAQPLLDIRDKARGTRQPQTLMDPFADDA